MYNFFLSRDPDKVYVIPGFASYTQQCRRDIVPDYNPDFNCSVGHTLLRYSVSPDDQHTIPVQFNVLGARPIDISVDVVWENHYPVDLHPSWDPVANTSTILHVSRLYSTPHALHTKFFHLCKQCSFTFHVKILSSYLFATPVIFPHISSSKPAYFCIHTFTTHAHMHCY